MSYDVRLVIDTGGEDPVCLTEYRCPTYNLAEMFSQALGCGLRDLAEKSAEHAIPLLRKAIADMKERPAHFRTFNPKNGWGTYESALEFFEGFLEECVAHPKATVKV